MEGPAIEGKVAMLETPTKRANIFVVFIALIKSLKCAANKPPINRSKLLIFLEKYQQ
jgi:hypothetical protein